MQNPYLTGGQTSSDGPQRSFPSDDKELATSPWETATDSDAGQACPSLPDPTNANTK